MNPRERRPVLSKSQLFPKLHVNEQSSSSFFFFCWRGRLGETLPRVKRFQKKGNSATLRHRRSPHDNPTPNTHIINLNNYVQKFFQSEKNK